MGIGRRILDRAIQNQVDKVLPKEKLFTFWDNVRDTMGVVTGDKRPTILKSNIDWFDSKFGLPNGNGLPFGTWVIINGPPGSSKTTNGLVIADGFGQHEDVEWHHYDGELGEEQTKHYYQDLSVVPDHYEWEPDGPTLIPRIIQRAKELELQKKSLVVLIDSFKLFGYSNQALQEAALTIKSARNQHKNLLWITINHHTKGKQIEGPANISQLCDILIVIGRRGQFRYLSTPAKNRFEMPTAPEVIKLAKGPNGKPFLSKEPDFFSENPLVVGTRNLLGRLKKK